MLLRPPSSGPAARVAAHDHQQDALPDLVLRRRHRLPGLVPQARRRGARDLDRQVLLPHAAATCRPSSSTASASSTRRSRTATPSTRSSTRRCARSCASCASSAASRSTTTATCPRAAASARARPSASACCTRSTRSRAACRASTSSRPRASTSSRSVLQETVGSQDQVTRRLRRLQPHRCSSRTARSRCARSPIPQTRLRELERPPAALLHRHQAHVVGRGPELRRATSTRNKRQLRIMKDLVDEALGGAARASGDLAGLRRAAARVLARSSAASRKAISNREVDEIYAAARARGGPRRQAARRRRRRLPAALRAARAAGGGPSAARPA